jgi:hypothetical protein
MDDVKLEDLSAEDLATIIRDLRKENAAKRVKDKDLSAQIKEYEEWKESQLTELEKARQERDSAIAESRTALIDLYADKHNVPEERRKFLSGATREEIEEAAMVLGTPKSDSGEEDEKNSKENPPPPSGPNLFPGASNRGTAVASSGSGGTDFDSVLREALRAA